MAKIITSAQNEIVQEWIKLKEDPKFRQKLQLCLLSGRKLIEEMIEGYRVETLIVTDKALIPPTWSREVVFTSDSIMKKITGLQNPEGIAAVVPLPEMSTFKGVKRLIALDGIQDPGNVGTLIRTALAFGWEGAYFLPGTCDPFNDKVVRASQGALFRLPIAVGNFEDLKHISKQEKLTVLGADIRGTNFEKIDRQKPLVLVLGSEGQGLSLETKKLCEPVTIPMSGQMESLNVAVAGAILLYGLNQNAL